MLRRCVALFARRGGASAHAPRKSKRAKAKYRTSLQKKAVSIVKKETRSGKGVHSAPQSVRRAQKTAFEMDGGPARLERFKLEGPVATIEPSANEIALLEAFDANEVDKEEFDQMAYLIQYGEVRRGRGCEERKTM